jgi:hypothetical protein
MNFRLDGWGGCAAAWTNTPCGLGRLTGFKGTAQAGSCVGESPSWSRHRILIPTCEGSSPSSPAKHLPHHRSIHIRGSMPERRTQRAVQHRAVHRQRQPGAGAGNRHPPGRRTGQGHGGPVLRRRGHGRDPPERARPRRVRGAEHLRTDQREPDGTADHGRCVEARQRPPHHRRDPLLRLRPARPPAAVDAGAHQRQGGGQPAGDGGRRACADDGPARRPDPGLLRHPGRQHLRQRRCCCPT